MPGEISHAALGSALFLLAAAHADWAVAQPVPHDSIAGIWDNGLTVNLNFMEPESGPGPVTSIAPRGGGVGPRGDYNAPILQPWAKDVIRTRVENDINDVFQTEPKETCHPMGRPHILQLNNVIHVLPGADVTVILYLGRCVRGLSI